MWCFCVCGDINIKGGYLGTEEVLKVTFTQGKLSALAKNSFVYAR